MICDGMNIPSKRFVCFSVLILQVVVVVGWGYIPEKHREWWGCSEALKQIEKPTEEWQFKLLDSYGKVQSGTYHWSQTFWWGQYVECNDVSIPLNEQQTPQVGKYCVALTNTSFSIQELRIGTCVPNFCSSEDLKENKNIMKRILDKKSFLEKEVKKVGINDFFCDDVPFQAINPFTFLFTAVIIVVVFASAYDYFFGSQGNKTSKEKSLGSEILLCFSLKRTAQKLLHESDKKHIKCLNGLRVLSMMCIYYFHLYDVYATEYAFLDAAKSFGKAMSTLGKTAISNAYLAVETFFVISGFLVGLKFPKDMSRGLCRCSFYLLAFYGFRFLRLAPPLLLISFYPYLFPALTKGPVAVLGMPQLLRDARNRWKWNLLFISNYFPDSCTDWTWYLTFDFQFYLMSPLLLILFQRKFRTGCVAAVFVVCVSCLLRSMVTYYFFTDPYAKNIPLDSVFVENGAALDVRLHMAWNVLYESLFYRIGPYVIGLLTGTFASFGEITLSNRQLRTGWLISATTGIALTTFLSYPDGNSHWLTACFNYGWRSTLWAIVVAWIIFTSFNDKGGKIGKFLSWHGWMIPSKLVYSFYLVHVIFIFWYFWNQTTTLMWSYSVWNTIYIGLMPLIIVASLGLHLFVEMPAILLGNILIRKML